MWNKFEASSNEDETVANSFLTAGLFKILNEDEVRKKFIEDPRRSSQNKISFNQFRAQKTLESMQFYKTTIYSSLSTTV